MPSSTLKPDIGAPGGLIRSTYPIELGQLLDDQRHVDGLAARGRCGGAAARGSPEHDRGHVRDILQNSADPKNRFGQTYLDNVHRQGAGMLDIDDAILATTMLTPGKLSLGEGNGGTRTIQLQNSSGTPGRRTTCRTSLPPERRTRSLRCVLHRLCLGELQLAERGGTGRWIGQRPGDGHARTRRCRTRASTAGTSSSRRRAADRCTACRTPASRVTTSRSRCSPPASRCSGSSPRVTHRASCAGASASAEARTGAAAA